jgi:hypothetical protein
MAAGVQVEWLIFPILSGLFRERNSTPRISPGTSPAHMILPFSFQFTVTPAAYPRQNRNGTYVRSLAQRFWDP